MQLTVKKLAVNRGERRIVDDLSFSLKAGQSMILLGPNGSGKTTLIRALAGFIGSSQGTIELTGPNLDPEIPMPEYCHYVGHANGTKSSLTVTENLDFWLSYLNPARSKAEQSSTMDALAQFNLADLADIPAGYMSAGQKRRLGLARLLIAKRPVWLLDEPTVSLDTQSVTLLANAVKTHLNDDGIVIAATHIPLGIKDAIELHLSPLQVQVFA